ncbi:MAG: hypothetical protein C5B49_11865 [Bdellovibrio sp.]|nr:MAG: hypothetical protein C5B49_11865 [Bdellovibrio sp.]
MATKAIYADRIPVMIDQRDLGKADTLRYNVMSFLREENYERAVFELEAFLKKPSDFPNFHDKVERYIQHGVALVRAVEMKRNFPGINQLTVAKQQDLKLKIKQHIDELVFVLKKVEGVEAQMRIEDIRSTVLVVRAAVLSIFAVAIVAFVVDLSRGLLWNFIVVVDDFFQTVSRWIAVYLG